MWCNMAIREIVIYPADILKKKCQQVEKFDDDLKTLVEDMAETMYAAPGVGLAAPQVGVSLRVAVIDVSVGERPDDLLVLINPETDEVLAAEAPDRAIPKQTRPSGLCSLPPGPATPVTETASVAPDRASAPRT